MLITTQLTAPPPAAPAGVSVAIANGTLTVTNANNFIGTFRITLSASDGLGTGTFSFLVTTV